MARKRRPKRRPSTLPARKTGAAAKSERTWVPLPDPAPGAKELIYVSFPAPPDEEALAEAESYLKSLESRRQIVREPGRPAPGATHRIEVDGKGRRCLIRQGFTIR